MMRHDERGLSEISILLILVLAIIVIIGLIAGGFTLVAALFVGGRFGAGLFLFVIAGFALIAWYFAVKQPAMLYLVYILIGIGLVFIVLGVLGR
jgi:hypothetical protein